MTRFVNFSTFFRKYFLNRDKVIGSLRRIRVTGKHLKLFPFHRNQKSLYGQTLGRFVFLKYFLNNKFFWTIWTINMNIAKNVWHCPWSFKFNQKFVQKIKSAFQLRFQVSLSDRLLSVDRPSLRLLSFQIFIFLSRIIAFFLYMMMNEVGGGGGW